MKQRSADITALSVPDLQALLDGREVPAASTAVFSLGEYAKMHGLSYTTAQRIVREAHLAGLIEPAGYAPKKNVHGRLQRTPVWRLKARLADQSKVEKRKPKAPNLKRRLKEAKPQKRK